MKILRSEPVLVVALVQAALVLAAAFGLHLSAEQIAAAVGFFSAVLAVVVRQAVASPATVVEVARQTAEALSGPSAGAVGTVTAKGEEIVDTVVSGVGGLVGALAPKLGTGD